MTAPDEAAAGRAREGKAGFDPAVGPADAAVCSARRPLAWLDGRIVFADEPHLLISDHGFQLGDGIFESLRARRGVVIDLDEHLARLHESAGALAIRLPDDQVLVEGIRALLEAATLADPGDAAIRITVSRGAVEGRGLLPPAWASMPSTVAIQAWPYAPPTPAVIEHGIAAIVSRVRRDALSPLAGVKSTSRAELVFAKLEADRRGADDAIFTTADGNLAEATTANIFIVSRGVVSTPPLSTGILAGTTRNWLVREGIARRLQVRGTALAVEERMLVPADLASADEAFLSSSVAGIVPLTQFEGRPIGDGRPGEVTLVLRAAREAWIEEAAPAAAHDRTRTLTDAGANAAKAAGAVEVAHLSSVHSNE